jgi:hypothetical protein
MAVLLALKSLFIAQNSFSNKTHFHVSPGVSEGGIYFKNLDTICHKVFYPRHFSFKVGQTSLNILVQGRTQGGGGGAPGYSPPPKPEFKNTDFVDIMISKVLRDLPFSRNQPLKSADV